MGGNEWTMTGPYQEDLAAAFRQAQDLELVRDDRGFPGLGIVELWQDEAWQEYIATGGTGTVLDFCELAVIEDEVPFVMRPLSQGEILAWAPDGRPTREQWDAAKRRLLDPIGRGQGRCTVLYRDGRPAAVGYWGCTAD
ncbi:hypothetical protein [Kitasatospora griseola]|uniref:hypothetical protein n=1 Tax=Kitasatospora griseola TaxID=2064 RepID=UPI001671730A|nr:hypothetical protein [Kitasatospora griseola]GGR08605.1 hypothetical protein GCM10010195_74130 [Kitasatospora griseola]